MEKNKSLIVSEGTRALARVSQHIGLVDKVLSAREEAFLMPKTVVLVFEREDDEPLRLEVDRNIEVLDLRQEGITTLPVEIGQLTNLTSLNLIRNKLTQLPVEIGKLTNLISLHLHTNRLTQLPAEIGQLTNLTSLHLRANRLTHLPLEIGNLINLPSLMLWGNGFSDNEKQKIKVLLPNCRISFNYPWETR